MSFNCNIAQERWFLVLFSVHPSLQALCKGLFAHGWPRGAETELESLLE